METRDIPSDLDVTGDQMLHPGQMMGRAHADLTQPRAWNQLPSLVGSSGLQAYQVLLAPLCIPPSVRLEDVFLIHTLWDADKHSNRS